MRTLTLTTLLVAATLTSLMAGAALALPHATAKLTGAQEVPPVVTGATGTGAFRLNETRTELTYDITVQGLSSALQLAHFHNAAAGVNGGVVKTITGSFTGNTATGVWRDTDAEPLTPALVAELMAGNIYVNVHTVNHGGGEIRGQLDLKAGIHLKATLNGIQEAPPVATPATGTAVLTLTDDGLAYDLTVEGLTSAITLAHFHNRIAGISGPVVKTITGSFTGNTATGIWTKTDAEPLTPALIVDLLEGELYLNVHTVNNGSGEVRGQIHAQSSSGMTGRLDGGQEVPPVATPATGTGSFHLNEARTELKYDVTVNGLTSALQLAHFHNAPAGVNGGVVKTLTASFVGNSASGVWTSTDAEPLTPALVNELLAGRIYINVHTVNFGNGEIRGQLRLSTGVGRTANLTGAQEVPPVATPATGTGSCVLTSAGVEYDITIEGLLGTFQLAHFHDAPAGVNGGVVKTITGSFSGFTATGVWAAGDAEPLTPARIARYLTGDLYLNVHTSSFGNGEIRGQLRSPSVVGIGPVASAPARTALEQNVPNPFNPTTAIRYELAQREHVSLRIYDAAGREVMTVLDEEQEAGPNTVTIDARGLASGVYLYRLETPSFSASRKLVLTR
jgi:hypothetical protein